MIRKFSFFVLLVPSVASANLFDIDGLRHRVDQFYGLVQQKQYGQTWDYLHEAVRAEVNYDLPPYVDQVDHYVDRVFKSPESPLAFPADGRSLHVTAIYALTGVDDDKQAALVCFEQRRFCSAWALDGATWYFVLPMDLSAFSSDRYRLVYSR